MTKTIVIVVVLSDVASHNKQLVVATSCVAENCQEFLHLQNLLLLAKLMPNTIVVDVIFTTLTQQTIVHCLSHCAI